MDNKNIITRFPPSPTGMFHVGSVRTALLNYLFAKQQKGEFILRIEDTDIARSKKEYEDDILKSLEWLGLDYDAFSRQSENGDLYKKYVEKMIADGTAYISKEEIVADESGEKKDRRAEVIRFKNPNKMVTFTDMIRGEVSVDTSDLRDFVIARSVDEPLYHLAVVVDDYESGVTHVIRGEDGLPNTARQILIQEAIGAERPLYAHLPLILATDRAKLSKRKHGEAVWLKTYIAEGCLKEAIINYMALLGWNPGTDQEIFSLDELVASFDISKVQKGGAIFDPIKLKWINKEHMNKLTMAEFDVEALKYIPDSIKSLPKFNERMVRVMPIIRERISVFGEIVEMANAGELSFFFEQPQYDPHDLMCPPKFRKDKEVSLWDLEKLLGEVIMKLGLIDEINFVSEVVKDSIWDFATEQGRGIILWAMRYALSGREKSPDPFMLSQVLGKVETLQRLQIAIDECLKAGK